MAMWLVRLSCRDQTGSSEFWYSEVEGETSEEAGLAAERTFLEGRNDLWGRIEACVEPIEEAQDLA
jgi:hypothetical protein